MSRRIEGRELWRGRERCGRLLSGPMLLCGGGRGCIGIELYLLKGKRSAVFSVMYIIGLLPISPNFRSSKIRKFFRLAISWSPLIVRSEKSSMMSACVLSTHIESPISSANLSRIEVEWTSAETQRLDFLIEMSDSR